MVWACQLRGLCLLHVTSQPAGWPWGTTRSLQVACSFIAQLWVGSSLSPYYRFWAGLDPSVRISQPLGLKFFSKGAAPAETLAWPWPVRIMLSPCLLPSLSLVGSALLGARGPSTLQPCMPSESVMLASSCYFCHCPGQE